MNYNMKIIIYFNKLSKNIYTFSLLKPTWHLVETKIPLKNKFKKLLVFSKTYFCKLEFEN
jgi:hypothetical protein